MTRPSRLVEHRAFLSGVAGTSPATTTEGRSRSLPLMPAKAGIQLFDRHGLASLSLSPRSGERVAARFARPGEGPLCGMAAPTGRFAVGKYRDQCGKLRSIQLHVERLD